MMNPKGTPQVLAFAFTNRMVFVAVFVASGLMCAALWGQTAVISLGEAQETALRTHPRVASAALSAHATEFTEKEVRSANYPTLSASITGVGSQYNGTLSSGAVTTSSIFNRASAGIVANQLLTDFGRTSSLVHSANLRNQSQNQNVNNVRAQILLGVQLAYYQALASESILKVAQATADLRRATLRQVTALAQSSLRSTLDVSFEEVNVSQAELDLFQAENDAKGNHARLSAAIGYERDQPFSLADESLPGPLDPDLDALIAQALRERPDFAALRLTRDALEQYAQAERRLRNPTIIAAAVAGDAPVRDHRLPETYAAAGVIISVPIFNGGLFKDRREEAESHAAAASKDVQDLAIEVARDVQVAWLNANDALKRLDVTARMVAEANEALRLAQARYEGALSSIVELNQAQVNQTSAQIAEAAAKYEYLARRAELNYAVGVLR
jgi:outer membrane protein